MARILGIDPGDVRHGLAVSDPTGTIASPYGFVEARSDWVDAVQDLCHELEVEMVVVGLPLRLDGTEGPAAQRSRDVATELEDRSDLEIEFWDERFTTVTAENALLEGNVRRAGRKQKRDQVAAAVMLQGFLDRRRHDDRSADPA